MRCRPISKQPKKTRRASEMTILKLALKVYLPYQKLKVKLMG